MQQVCGKLLYYGRAVDNTIIHALNGLSTRVKDGTELTMDALNHFLDYFYDNSNAIKLYKSSDMILYVDSDAEYLVEQGAKSRAGGYFYLGNKNGNLINGSIHIIEKIIKHVMSSEAKVEIAALFMNAKAAIPIRQALIEIGHPQLPTKMKTDNSTANGFANITIKEDKIKAIEMRFHWLKCREAQQQFQFYWAPGKANIADYFTKNHSPAHHKAVRSIYLHENNSQLSMKGCIIILSERAIPAKTFTTERAVTRKTSQNDSYLNSNIGRLFAKLTQLLNQLTHVM